MRNKIKKLLAIIPTVTIMASCGGGNSVANTPKPQPPSGVISYDYISAIYNDINAQRVENESKQSNYKHLRGAGQGLSCQNPLQLANWGLTFVRNFLGFIPGVGSYLSAAVGTTTTALSIAGTVEGNSCQSASTNIVNQELQQQQQQINQIESTLGLLENSFYTQNVAVLAGQTGTDIYNYNQAFLSLAGNGNSGVDGYFQQFMRNSSLWSYDYVPQPNIDAESIVANSTALNNLNTFVVAPSNFTDWVNSLSGSQYDQSACANSVPYNSPNKSYNCYNYVTQSSATDTSSIILAYKSIYQQLVSQVNLMLNQQPSNQQNVVPLFDQYNQVIVSLYLKSAYALQEAFFMEQMINQINLYESQGGSPQLPSIGGTPGTWFSYNNYSSGESQGYYVAQYNQAQEQLALMYAARYNQLYINTLSYIISDSPKGNQSLPSLVFRYAYNGIESSLDLSQVYTNISLAVESPTSLLFSGANQLNSLIKDNMFIYQFSGLKNVQSCNIALNNYNLATNGQGVLSQGLNAQNCPAIFEDDNGNAYSQAYYSGNSFQPYYAPQGQQPVLTGMIQNAMAVPLLGGVSVQNSTAACQSNQNLYWYTPNGSSPTLATVGTTYVSCNLWQTSIIAESPILQNYTPNLINSSSTWGPTEATKFNSGYSTLINLQVNITPISADSWNNFNTVSWSSWCYKNAPTNCFPIAGMSGQSAQSIESNTIILGNMQQNYVLGNPYSVHQMAFQVTAPDGFVSSFVMQYFSAQGVSGNNVGITCNQMLNNVAFVSTSGMQTPIQKPCNQTTNNPNTPMVNQFLFAPLPDVQSGGGSDPSVLYGIFNITSMFYTQPTDAINGAVLATNDYIKAQSNQAYIYSPSNLAYLVMQADGNLVLYGYSKSSNGYKAIWATNTVGSGTTNYLVMQYDGNLVMYPNDNYVNGTSQAIWATGTNGQNLYLSVQDDGNMVIYNQQDQPVWATNTNLPQ